MLDPKYLKDRAGQLPSYVTLGTLAADEVVTLGRVNAAISTTPSATRTALGLGTAATANSVDFATSAQGTLAGTALQPGTLPLGTTLNSTEANTVVNFTRVNAAVAANPSGLRTTLGLGTAALVATTAFATAAQGTLAGTALQPGTLPLGTTLNATEANSIVNFTRVNAALGTDAATARNTLGLGSAALSASTAFATAAQGTLAGTALQPGTLPLGTTLNATEADSLVSASRVRAGIAADAAAARTSMGLGSAAVQPDSRYVRSVLGNAPDGSGNVSISVLTEETAYVSHAIRGFFSASYPRQLAQSLDDMYRARVWSPDETVEVGAVRLPTAYNLPGIVPGTVKIHRCIQAGKTGKTEPTWATTDFYVNSTSSDTTDNTAVWRAYNIIHVDISVADNSGDGSQGAPYRDWRAAPFTSTATLLTSAWSPGRCVALKRNSVFNSYQPTGLEGYLARMFIRKPSGATALYPERRTVMAYGQGRLPVIEGGANGVLRFGIRVLETSAASHEGFITFQDIAVTAVGGTLAGSGGAGIMIPVLSSEASPGYSTHPNGCVLLGCKVYDFYMKDFGTESGPDVDGIQTFGADVTIVNCEVTNCGDDNYWILGSNLKVVGNRSSGSARHSVAWPNRQRGDEMQINSSPWNGNGDTVCHNVLVVGNSLIHDNPNKHVLIINPEVTGTNTLSRNYQVSYNYMESAKPSAGGISQLPFYCSGFEGTVNNNFIVSNHTRPTTDNPSVFLNCAAEFFNNLVIVNGNYRGIEVGSVSLNGGAVVNTAKGARIYNNTVVNRGTSTMGVLNWTAGVTVAVYNNTIIGFTTGIQLVTGSQGGYNAFQNCTTNYNGGGTMLGGDITGVDLKTYYGIPYSSTSPLRSAGLVTGDALFDTFSGARRIGSRPTIGCEEAPVI